jgi:hypothetical protein
MVMRHACEHSILRTDSKKRTGKTMTATEIISLSRKLNGKDLSEDLVANFAFKSDNSGGDFNLEYRTQIIEELLANFSIADIKLIRTLFNEELKCEIATQRHDNLYQICFYLFHLGQLADTFILYDAKFNAKNMDVGCMLDREMITVGHNVDEVIEYVEATFQTNPPFKEKYSGIIEALKDLKEFPDYDSIDAYHLFIRGYFYGHDNVS